MAVINFGKTVSLKQAAAAIGAVPENVFELKGEPGIGKSQLLLTLARMYPDHNVAYIDVPNMDLGDIAMPVVDHETKTTRYYPNSRFRLTEGKPVIIMLDEFSKGADPVKNMLHPLLEVYPRLGDVPLPPGSIVFTTGNLSSDGVGDNVKAHTTNRLSRLHVRKPTAEEWLEWAVSSDKIDGAVMAFVKYYPHIMASYLDEGQEDNPYIFNPKKQQHAYASPRSLERASNIIRQRDKFDSDTLIAALSGTVGEATARDMEASIAYADQLPSWENITKNPKSAPIPDSTGACAVLIYGAIAKITKETITPFMGYLERFEPEWQATFITNVAKNPDKQQIAFSSSAFRDWLQKNQDLL